MNICLSFLVGPLSLKAKQFYFSPFGREAFFKKQRQWKAEIGTHILVWLLLALGRDCCNGDSMLLLPVPSHLLHELIIFI